MKLVIVSGATATGKTTIASELANMLSYSLYSKDVIKETLFESERSSSHGFFWNERGARDIFYQKIEKSISQNRSIVIENNFLPEDRRRLCPLIASNIDVTEIYCFASGFSRLKRFIGRGENKARHNVHVDRRFYVTVLIGCVIGLFGIHWPYGPVTKSKLFKLDTTDFSKVNTQKILKFVKQA